MENPFQKEIEDMNRANSELAETLANERDSNSRNLRRKDDEIQNLHKKLTNSRTEAVIDVERALRDGFTQHEATVRRAMHVELLMCRRVLSAELCEEQSMFKNTRCTAAHHRLEQENVRLRTNLQLACESKGVFTTENVQLKSDNQLLKSQVTTMEAQLNSSIDNFTAASTALERFESENKILKREAAVAETKAKHLKDSNEALREKMHSAEETHSQELHNTSEKVSSLVSEIMMATHDASSRLTLEESASRSGFVERECVQRSELLSRFYSVYMRVRDDMFQKLISVSETQQLAERVLHEQCERETAVLILKKEAETTLDQLESVLRKKEAALLQIGELLTMQSSLQHQLAESESIADKLRTENESLRGKSVLLSRRVTDSQKHASELKTQLSLVVPYDDSALTSNVRRDVREYQNEIQILKKQYQEAKQGLSASETALGKAKIDANKRLVELEAAQSRNREQQKTIAGLKKDLEKRKKSTPETPPPPTTKEVAIVPQAPVAQQPPGASRVEYLKILLTDKEDALGKIRSENAGLRVKIAMVETEVDTLRARNSELTEMVGRESPEVDRLQVLLDAAVRGRQDAETECKSHREEAELAWKHRQDQLDEIQKTEFKLTELHADADHSRYELEKTKTRLKEREEEVRNLQSDVKNLQTELTESYHRTSTAAVEISAIVSERSSEKERYNTILRELKTQVQQAEMNNTQNTSLHVELAEENTVLKHELESLKRPVHPHQKTVNVPTYPYPSVSKDALDEAFCKGAASVDVKQQYEDGYRKGLAEGRQGRLKLPVPNTDSKQHYDSGYQKGLEEGKRKVPHPSDQGRQQQQQQLGEAYRKGLAEGRAAASQPCERCANSVDPKQLASMQQQCRNLVKERRVAEKRWLEDERSLMQEVDTLRGTLQGERATHLKEVTELRANTERLHARSESRLTKVKSLQSQLREAKNLPEPESIVTEDHPSDPTIPTVPAFGSSKKRRTTGKCGTCGRPF